jgi:hypothetical protein
MEKKPEETSSDEWLNGLPTSAVNPAFKPDELIICAKCARANPPTRTKCLYCGAALTLSEAQSKYIKPALRKLESWEKGFNLIYLPDSNNVNESSVEEIAWLLKVEKEWLQKIVRSKKDLPFARLETEKEAEIIQQRLDKLRIKTQSLSDVELHAERPPRRLRAMDFWDDKLILIFFNVDEIAEVYWNDLSLIVTGAIYERKIETTEEHSKKGENKLLETNETASDEILIDIYSRQDKTGYRIEQNGFDFSCLGAEKSFLVGENIRKLAKTLAARAPEAKLEEDYLQIRSLLANVWEVEEKTESQGLKREKFARFNRASLTTISNSAQFTKYSRLLRHLL